MDFLRVEYIVGIDGVGIVVGGVFTGLEPFGDRCRAVHAVNRIPGADTALDPQFEHRAYNPEDRVDGPSCVSAIAEIVTQLLDRRDHDAVQSLEPEEGQNVLVESGSKIGNMRRTAVDF